MNKKSIKNLRLSFGQRVRKIRKSRNYTQAKVSALTGMDVTYISSFERGERNVSLVNIYRLAKALGVTASYLIKGVTPGLKKTAKFFLHCMYKICIFVV